MPTAGPNFAGAGASATEAGDADAWVNPGNIVADDAAEAQITAASFDSPDRSSALRASIFGFDIPTDATIAGVTVEVERRVFAGSASDSQIQLFSAPGTLIGNNKSAGAAWPATAAVASYGGAADLWGATLTPAIVNASTFGVQVKCVCGTANVDVGVDFIRMTVEYTGGTEPVAKKPTIISQAVRRAAFY